MKIKLITDSACDLPLKYIEENSIEVVSLEVNIKGEFVKDDLGKTLTSKHFYNLLREGEQTSTSQVNIHTFEEVFKKYIEAGYSIICINLASALSGTYNSAAVAKKNILEYAPNADITVIDSKTASMGEGMLVCYANEMLKHGDSKETVTTWLETNRTKINLAITVDDLGYLKRGGRISGAVALVGGLLHIKPTISLDSEGKVIPGPKIKGSKNALKYLVNEIKEKGIDVKDQTLLIAHADCVERAQLLRELILTEIQVKDVVINCIGAVIGTHVGPEALAVAFMGKDR